MKLQTFFENLKRQRDAIFTFARHLILASKSFSFVVQFFFKNFVHYQIVDLRCVFIFSAKFCKSDAFTFFRRNIDLTTFFFSRLSEFSFDFVAMFDNQNIMRVFV